MLPTQGFQLVQQLQNQRGRGGTGIKIAMDAPGAANARQVQAAVTRLRRAAVDADDFFVNQLHHPVGTAAAGAHQLVKTQVNVGIGLCQFMCPYAWVPGLKPA